VTEMPVSFNMSIALDTSRIKLTFWLCHALGLTLALVGGSWVVVGVFASLESL
jgi:hypothetical protein